MESRHCNNAESSESVAAEHSGHHRGDCTAARIDAHDGVSFAKSARTQNSHSRGISSVAEIASFAAAASPSQNESYAAANPKCIEADGGHEGQTSSYSSYYGQQNSGIDPKEQTTAAAAFFHSHHNSTETSHNAASHYQTPPSQYNYYPSQSLAEEEHLYYYTHSNKTNSTTYNDETDTTATNSDTPRKSNDSVRDKLLPNMISLATRLLPTVVQRLTRQEQQTIRHFRERCEEEDDFLGKCAPLGNSADSTSLDPKGSGNPKTTGMDERDHLPPTHRGASNPSSPPLAHHRRISDLEMGDPMEYLPQSAALLVSALESSAKKKRRGGETSSVKDGNDNDGDNDDDGADGERGDDEGSFALGELPPLVDERDNGSMGSRTGSFDHGHRRRKLSHSDMERLDREAEALMDSIRRGDWGGDGSNPSGPLASAARNLAMEGGIGVGAITGATADAASFDDDDSIRGDMIRLNQSIECLQRDLQNVDLSFFDEIYDDGFGGLISGGGGENDWDGNTAHGMLARLKMWFSRGAIMEQKLLHTFTSTSHHHHGGDGSSGTTTRTSGYADNPVLIWSMALMWAFVILIAGHVKIADWVEGGDAGQLADIVEWLFYAGG
mmetsp:Transcript_3195/g.6804  ORF Transcript_3195/g.6804 Transcript_3195/m.6804 type:complete len:611 (+) Transcript_3195:253-2085(+)